jgi:DnaJ-domain-containing protein 1
MATVLVGIVALLIILWFVNKFVQANPKGVAFLMQRGGGAAVMVVAVYLTAIGQLAVALPLAFMGLNLLGWLPSGLFGMKAKKSAAQVSRVRSNFLEMELDHDTGGMHGRIIAGRHAGVALEALETSALVSLLMELDEESRALLMAYLDRRDARWREHAQGDAAAGQGGSLGAGKMTKEEAYQILGLQPGASAEEIGRAHRSLMKKLHPDQGGSTYLAARVNEAKDVLLRSHR